MRKNLQEIEHTVFVNLRGVTICIMFIYAPSVLNYKIFDFLSQI